ncbi:phospholipase effector Tle1 domain-containing protein [Hahella ganghwensis]|uniref:phospholipase effector Tle1 domain-containing protein n=1 Tax=Hahella ganghwensis TaxID=286420 RepID=UPI00035DE2A3|nr:DUF2235 domain-containing protein [Hahella ganghwensis]
MSKSIIICCDGTWNRPESDQDPSALPSNVLKLVRSIVPRANGVEQVVYYDSGVGTGGFWDKWIGGALGAGVSDNIMEAYRFLVNNWSEGDRIYLFGFSRGAYTVRSLAGLVNLFGLLHKRDLKFFPCIYRYYRTDPARRINMDYEYLARNLQDSVIEGGRKVAISFMGVWDTVGALGIPVSGLRELSKKWVGFHDTQLSDTVEFAVQALAIDELRKPFAPDLWTQHPGSSEKRCEYDNRRILQVWMPGAHSDVGGGFPEAELSDLALNFMFDQATSHGLMIDRDSVISSSADQQALGEVHNLQKGFYELLGDYPRPIGTKQAEAVGLQLGINEKLHWSIGIRREQNVTSLNKGNLYAALNDKVPVYHNRQHHRMAVDQSAEMAFIKGHDTNGEYCQILDYSAGGARVAVPLPQHSGNPLQIKHDYWGERQARVMWVRGRETGLAFAA